MDEDDKYERPKLRPRVSLLNLLLSMAVVALAVPLYLQSQQLKLARSEIENLRTAAGYLVINDSEKLHVVAAPLPGTFRYRWRIHMPGGHDYALFTYRGKVAKAALPNSTTNVQIIGLGGKESPFVDREVTLDAELRPRFDGGYEFGLSRNGESRRSVLFPDGLPDWAKGGSMRLEDVTGRGKTRSIDAAEAIRLVHLDGVKAGGITSNDAVLIWIGPYTSDVKEAVKLLENSP